VSARNIAAEGSRLRQGKNLHQPNKTKYAVSATSWSLVFLLGMTACANKLASRPSAAADAIGCKAHQTLPIPAALESDVQRSIVFGRWLYLQDRASAVGTDVVLANTGPDERAGLVGYLTIRDGTEDGQQWSSANTFASSSPKMVHK
jgi:hypothetical protein